MSILFNKKDYKRRIINGINEINLNIYGAKII